MHRETTQRSAFTFAGPQRLFSRTNPFSVLNSTDRMNEYFGSGPGIVAVPSGSRTSLDQIVAYDLPLTSRSGIRPRPEWAIKLNGEPFWLSRNRTTRSPLSACEMSQVQSGEAT